MVASQRRLPIRNLPLLGIIGAAPLVDSEDLPAATIEVVAIHMDQLGSVECYAVAPSYMVAQTAGASQFCDAALTEEKFS